MSDQIYRLIYPASLISVPIINQLIRQFDITVNIVKAQITPEEGWVEVQLAGNPMVIEDAITWLKAQGIEVEFKPE
ncbi:MAG: NIL domain-containing protein [Anaerolineaceae bacterium]